MTRALLPVLIVLIASTAVAEPKIQTDWSGGDGVAGPVAEFGNRFDSGSLAWRPVSGQIALRSTPRSTFPVEVITPDSDRPKRIAVADIDADGYQDIIVTDPIISPFDPDNLRGAIYLWQFVDGNWTMTSITEEFYGAWYVDTVDLDEDGDLDLIATAYYGEIDPPPPPPEARNGRYAWFENLDGVGGAWEKRELGELFWGARWIDAADIDGDGDLDLAGCAELVGGPYEADAFVVWFENVDGQGEEWIQHDVSDDFDNAFSIHAVDVDGDTDIDFLVSGYDRFEWFENLDGAGGFWTRHVVSPTIIGSGYFDVGDLDGDGDIDFVGSGKNNGVLAAWLNDGTGLNWTAIIIGSFSRGYNVHLADIDGDSDLDAVASAENGTTNGKLAVAVNLSNGTAWSIRYPDFSTPNRPWAHAGDVDRDGKVELVACFEDAYNEGIQIEAYTITDFTSDGMLQSSVLDGGTPSWGTLSWDADVAPGTTLGLEIRASNDPGDLGSYVAVPASGTDLGTLIDPTARYIQYRVTMDTSNGNASPVLREILLENGEPAAVGEDPTPSPALTLSGASPNPMLETTSVAYRLAEAARVRAAVYDASGRQVVRLEDSIRGPGSYEVSWNGLDASGHATAAGMYFLRLRAGAEEAVRRVVRVR